MVPEQRGDSGDVKYSTGNGAAKELTRTTHGRDQWGGAAEGGGMRGGGGNGGEIRASVTASSAKCNYENKSNTADPPGLPHGPGPGSGAGSCVSVSSFHWQSADSERL